MRKLFLNLMAVAICSLVITSCVKGPDDIPPSPEPTPTPTPTPEETYDKAFKAYVGGTIAPNQDWGFGTAEVAETRLGTRAEDQGNYDLSEGYPKKYYWDFIKEVLDSLPEGQTVGESIKNFEFISRGPIRIEIPYTFTYGNFEIGYYYYNPNQQQNVFDRTEKTLFSNFESDFVSKKMLQYSTIEDPSESQWETVETGFGPWLWDQEKGYEGKVTRARMITLRDGSETGIIDVPKGYRVGFYVKRDNKTFYTNRYLNEDEKYFFAVLDSKNQSSHLKNAYIVGMEDLEDSDFDCNDVVLDVHKMLDDGGYPLLYIPRKTWRIIAEDLSASENTDFDFNDIVLDVTLTKTGADCVLQAAGAELPIAINGEYDRLEVHKMFGVGDKDMVNTNAPKGVKKDPVEFSIIGKFYTAKDVKIEVKKADGKWHELYAKTGDAACKIQVTTDFVWPNEQESIKVKYPKFVYWVKDPSVVWYPN